MNLIQGRLAEAYEMRSGMASLEQMIEQTLQKPLLDPILVINACDALAASLSPQAVLPVLHSLGMEEKQAQAQFSSLRQQFGKEYLTRRLHAELGPDYGSPTVKKPFGLANEVQEQILPLGVLFHIAAGNMDGLPVYSVIEGLLAGNINLLKLPAVDGGLSVMLLQKLFEIQPLLAEYVYVFELSSSETDSLQQLAQLADAVVVWGGDEAVRAVRSMAPANVRVIEWGHKLSFAYVTKQGMTKAKLEGLAHNICATNQLLCSSCQGIFVDTDEPKTARDFCRVFLPVLESVALQYPEVPLSAKAQSTLRLYSRALEKACGDKAQVFRGQGVSLTLEEDDALISSLQFRNPWVKCLPRNRVIPALHPYKNHLQTAALLCGAREWNPLRDALWRAGVVRVSSGADMSDTYCGAAHDGEYPLRRYTRVVSAQK